MTSRVTRALPLLAFGLALCLALTSQPLRAQTNADSSPPNLIVILTDDQGWGDLSLHGNRNLATPHLDSLARDGAQFEYFYVSQVCAPTRAEFLTGRYHPRTGVSGVSRGQGRLNPDETTLAELLQKAGYATGAFGKWHNGTQPPYHPNDRGFDEFYGFTSGHWGHYFSPPLDHNGERVRGEGYVVDDFTTKALAFIDTHQDRPFFCYLPYNTPHSPMMIDDAFYAKFEGLDPEMRHREPEKEDLLMTRAALAMCENIDWNVGRVLAKLDELELSKNTIVVFFSDNGPNSWRWNGGLRGRKGSIDEGGLRSPCFIRWPGGIEAGRVLPQIAAAIDLLPTLCALTGTKAETRYPIDGLDLSPLLLGKGRAWPDRSLFSLKQDQVSVRHGRYRLDSRGGLYDIPTDPGQTKDLSTDQASLHSELLEQAKAFHEEMAPLIDRYTDRPFTVGFGPSTTLTARDGVASGTIRRSSKAPNNSFYQKWSRTDDAITWDVEVGEAGDYEAVVWYTCAAGDVGAELQLAAAGGASTRGAVTEAFDPPHYDKAKERVPESHYFVKDFKPLSIGRISLEKGRQTLTLTAPTIPGDHAIDFQALDLIRR